MESQWTLEEIEDFIEEAGSDYLSTFGGLFEGGVQCQQVPEEFAACIFAILESGEQVETYLEIGSAAGGSVFIMDHFFKPARIVLVDNNQHPKAHIRPYILRDVPREEITGNSHDHQTATSVRNLGIYFDVIMIDGDHYYEGVHADVIAYGAFLRPGGFLIFHDSQIGKPYGCYQIAQELKANGCWETVGEYVSGEGPICGTLLLKKVDNENN